MFLTRNYIFSLASGYIAAMLRGFSEPECVSVGMNSAVQSLSSPQTVPSTLLYQSLDTSLSVVELPLTGKYKLQIQITRQLIGSMREINVLAHLAFPFPDPIIGISSYEQE